MKTFYFNTGVKAYNSSYMAKNDIRNCHGERLIPFDCDNVPENATLKYLCDNPDLEQYGANMIIKELFNTTMCSKYAYFFTPTI